MSYKDFPKLEVKRIKLVKELEEKSYEGDSKIYEMEEMSPINYGKIEIEDGLYPEEKYLETNKN